MSTDERSGRRSTVEPDEPDLLLADGDAHPDAEEAQDAPARRRRRVRRVLIGVGVALLVLLLLIGGGAWYLTERYAGNVERLGDVFADVPDESRPEPAQPTEPGVDGDPVTFLLIGSDTRADVADGELPDARSDAIMLARIGADRQSAQVISIPRDSWVEIPGRGMNKINAAYAFGGPSLLIQTIEQMSGVRVDHFAALDFDGLIQLTDDLGGVDVVVAEETRNGPYTFTQGANTLDGEKARWYLAQRYGLAGGDFDRVKRHQQFMKAVLDKMISSETFSSVGRIDSTLRTVTDSVAVSDSLGNTDMVRLAYSMRNLTQDEVDFFTVPVEGTGMEGPASVVYLNEVAAGSMWEYLRTDSLGANAHDFEDEALPDTPR